MIDKSTKKYLSKYAQKEIEAIAYPINKKWFQAVIIPVFAESDIYECLYSIEKAATKARRSIVVILCINERRSTVQKDRDKNKTLAEFVKNKRNCLGSFVDIVVIDCFSRSKVFSEEEGVGKARKIAADFALRLYSHNKIQNCFFLSTDADARISENYFVDVKKTPDSGRLSFVTNSFKHFSDDKNINTLLIKAHILYEINLRLYVLALKWARSIYAFYTIGSIISVNYEYYAKVRGFPQLLAGEDFYLLNKLIKVAPYRQSQRLIKLKIRESNRVPFGTSVASSEIMRSDIDKYTFHANLSYKFLQIILEFYRNLNFADVKVNLQTILQKKLSVCDLSTQEVEKLIVFVIRQGLFKQIQTAQKSRKTQTDFIKHLDDFYDGLKTIQLIKYVDRLVGKKSLQESIKEYYFIDSKLKQQLLLYISQEKLEKVSSILAGCG